jgi:hypothetical protein
MKWKGNIDFDVLPQVGGTEVSLVDHTHAGLSKYDRQSVYADNGVSTNSDAVFVTIPDMVFNTKDLGEPGTYILRFTGDTYGTGGGAYTNFYRFTIGGVSNTQFSRIAVDNYVLSMSIQVTGISSGTEIKVEYRSSSSSNTIFVEARSFIIDGVPDSTIVS